MDSALNDRLKISFRCHTGESHGLCEQLCGMLRKGSTVIGLLFSACYLMQLRYLLHIFKLREIKQTSEILDSFMPGVAAFRG